MYKLFLEIFAYLLLSIKSLTILNVEFLYWDTLSCAFKADINMIQNLTL
jgi:Na+/H+ antiporter NhaB